MKRQRGSFAMGIALVLLVLVSFLGVAIDLANAGMRRAALQSVADTAAVAAVRSLDGTMNGITAAKTQAAAAVSGNGIDFGVPVVWSSAALSFAAMAATPDTDWIAADSVSAANVTSLRYARVDTAKLDAGTVHPLFYDDAQAGEISVSAVSVAGRTMTQLAPIAVCAMSASPASARANALGAGNEELVEYGFRRGVTYNLLNLNPAGVTPLNFVVNPVDFPPAANNSTHLGASFVAPFACSGTMPAPALSTLYVSSPFPSSLAAALNVRFDSYSGSPCQPGGTPPDINVLDYKGYTGFWMQTWPTTPSAQPYSAGGALRTVADPLPTPAGTTAASYGTLWAYARPVRYSAAAPDHAGTAFDQANWSSLYPVSSGSTPTAVNYSNSVDRPYIYNRSPNALAPSHPAALYRRILNVPLLSCPVPAGGAATVLAVGKFMLTAHATASTIPAEFGGLTASPPQGVEFRVFR